VNEVGLLYWVAYRICGEMRNRKTDKVIRITWKFSTAIEVKPYPFSAKSIAGVSTSSNVTLPDPSFSTVSTHAAAAPGTVAAFKSSGGSSEPLKPRVFFT
jgi:hypothetical protein